MIYRTNQWTGFYMIGTFVMKELRINELNILREKVPECQKQPPSGGKESTTETECVQR